MLHINVDVNELRKSNLCSDTATPHREDNGLNETSIFEWLGPKWLEGRRFMQKKPSWTLKRTSKRSAVKHNNYHIPPIAALVAASLNFSPVVNAATATA